MKEYNATLIDYGEGKGKLVVESKFGKVTFAVKADSHMWVELERPHGEWIDTGEMEEYWAEEYKCSLCGVLSHWHYFCPNCGASMKEGDEK